MEIRSCVRDIVGAAMLQASIDSMSCETELYNQYPLPGHIIVLTVRASKLLALILDHSFPLHHPHHSRYHAQVMVYLLFGQRKRQRLLELCIHCSASGPQEPIEEV